MRKARTCCANQVCFLSLVSHSEYLSTCVLSGDTFSDSVFARRSKYELSTRSQIVVVLKLIKVL